MKKQHEESCPYPRGGRICRCGQNPRQGAVLVTAISVLCRNCQAAPGSKCTQPSDKGRYTVNWFHHVREYDAQVASQKAREEAAR